MPTAPKAAASSRSSSSRRRRTATRPAPTRSTPCCGAPCSAASVKDAVSDVAAATGRPRREIYQRALAARGGPRWRGGVAPIRHGPSASPRSGSGCRRRAGPRPISIAKGYRIAARRFRSPVGEVDIVARRGARAGLRRGEGAQHAGRRGGVAATAPAAPDRGGGLVRGSRSIRTTSTARSALTPCWSRRERSRATFRRRSRRNRSELARAKLQGEFFDLIADPVGDPAELFRHRAHRHDIAARVFGRVVDPADLFGGVRRCAWPRCRRCARSPASPRPAPSPRRKLRC